MDLFFSNTELVTLSRKAEGLKTSQPAIDIETYSLIIGRMLEAAIKGNYRVEIPINGLNGVELIREVLSSSYISASIYDDTISISWQ
ncbi:MAG: hypothetical protein E6772_16035 [Dysgonomonas sp.]|nr:hypothetical protein [Dysgonomonas sp.]